MKTIKLVDPPSGWKYGFPKQYIESDGLEPKDLKEWLVRNGYPQSEIDSLGKHFYCQWNELPVEKKVVGTQTYIIKREIFDDGSVTLTRTNDGFASLELLGMITLISLEVKEQILGKMKPDVINRQVVKD
jgi:hypothetical protein